MLGPSWIGFFICMNSELFLKYSGLSLKCSKLFLTYLGPQPCWKIVIRTTLQIYWILTFPKSAELPIRHLKVQHAGTEKTSFDLESPFFLSFFWASNILTFHVLFPTSILSAYQATTMAMVHFKKTNPNRTTIVCSLKRWVSACVTHNNIHISHLVYRYQPRLVLVDIPISTYKKLKPSLLFEWSKGA